MKTVYVVGGDVAVESMFSMAGWITYSTFTPEALEALGREQAGQVLKYTDLVCFTGGADVMPQLYGEKNEGLSYCNPARDLFEESVYKQFVNRVPMVGICRGGQFLNVMNGGKLIQHLGKTVHGDVLARRQLRVDMYENHTVRVDHHQGIVPTSDADDTLLYLPEMSGLTYACYYSKTKCLCFQPHPEWGHEPTKELFFQLLKEYLNV